MSKTRNLANSAPQFNALVVPVGSTAQRPSATPGYIRFNTDLGTLESANSTAWANVGSGSASSGGSGISWTATVQNTSFIAVKNTGYFVNTATGNVTVTLPSSPTVGDTINFVDYGGQLSSNGLIFYPNGNKINANTINVSVITSTASVGLVYSDNNKGWIAYSGFTTSPIGPYSIEYLIVAGGGGGGSGLAGGGGAGGVLTAVTTINSGTSYSITVGSGGAGGTAGSYNVGVNGSNSSGFGATALGGGGGGGYAQNGSSGGCGGGGGTADGSTSQHPGGAGTAGQGYAGGTGNLPAQDAYPGGGGGGSAAVGSNSSGRNAGPGGSGIASSISGSSVYYGGGGGGSAYSVQSGVVGSGGAGGGTDGSLLGISTSGTANRGGGSGGGGYNSGALGAGAGGSGIVIVRYLGPQRANGGTVTQSGGYTIHTFTTSGTFTA